MDVGVVAYDLRTNEHYTLRRADLGGFLDAYRPGKPRDARVEVPYPAVLSAFSQG